MHIDSFRVETIYVSDLPALEEDLKRRQANPSLSSILSEISSLSAQIAPPTNIAAELTGVPSSVFVALANPTALAALESQFIASPPAWFTTLPADAQSYFLSVAPKYASIVPQISSLEIAAELITVSAASLSTAASSLAQTTLVSTSNLPASSLASSPSSTSSHSNTAAVLGPGAIAGISIGAIAVLAFVAALGWFLGTRQQKQKLNSDPSLQNSGFHAIEKVSELYGNDRSSRRDAANELGGNAIHEPEDRKAGMNSEVTYDLPIERVP